MPESIRRLTNHLDPALAASLDDIWNGSTLRLVSAVWWENTRPWNLPVRRCPDTFLLIPVSGQFECELPQGDSTGDPQKPGHGASPIHRVRPGQALLLSPDTEHSLCIAPQTKRLEQVSFHFHLSDGLGLDLARNLTEPICELPDAATQRKRLERTVALAGQQPEAAQAMLKSIVAEILECAALAGKFRSRPGRTDDPRIAAALHYLRENLGCDLSVENLARHVGLGTVRFRQLFQKATGSPPRKFIVHARLTEAANRLRRTSDSIATIAARCGFPTEGHFYATFRREYGVTPRQWRKQGVYEPQQRL